jgi:hypothetical protein
VPTLSKAEARLRRSRPSGPPGVPHVDYVSELVNGCVHSVGLGSLNNRPSIVEEGLARPYLDKCRRKSMQVGIKRRSGRRRGPARLRTTCGSDLQGRPRA